MANCSFCGKKLGTFENTYRKFDGDSGICKECNHLFTTVIAPLIKNMSESGQSETKILDVIVDSYADNENKKEFLINYLNKNWFHFIKEEQQKQKEEEYKIIIQQNKRFIKLTTGYNFDGYHITSYKGIISGETVIGTGLFSEFLASSSDLIGMNSNSFSQKMRAVKDNAIDQLRARAVCQDANAVIGVDFDYITFGNNMIGVSANGTAVVIEKNE